MANFTDILNKSADDITPQPAIPQGSYHAIVMGLPEQGKSSKKKTDFLKFVFKIIAPEADVDPEAIAEFEADGETIAGQEMDYFFYVTEKNSRLTENMLKEFIINCGIDLGSRTLAEGLDDMPNSEVIIFVKHETNNENGRINARVGATAKII